MTNIQVTVIICLKVNVNYLFDTVTKLETYSNNTEHWPAPSFSRFIKPIRWSTIELTAIAANHHTVWEEEKGPRPLVRHISNDETATIVMNRRTMRSGYRVPEIIASGTRTNWPDDIYKLYIARTHGLLCFWTTAARRFCYLLTPIAH